MVVYRTLYIGIDMVFVFSPYIRLLAFTFKSILHYMILVDAVSRKEKLLAYSKQEIVKQREIYMHVLSVAVSNVIVYTTTCSWHNRSRAYIYIYIYIYTYIQSE